MHFLLENYMTKLLKIIISFAAITLLLSLFWRVLFYTQPDESPSALIGEEVPSFQLVDLTNSQKKFTSQELKGRMILLNVWASWCYACQLETTMLLKINHTYHIPIYGIAYKDNTNDVKQWLQKFGNPYVKIGDDKSGDVAIDLGVYGTPETFFISPQGKIVYRHVGVIDQKVWDEVLYPLVKKYEN